RCDSVLSAFPRAGVHNFLHLNLPVRRVVFRTAVFNSAEVVESNPSRRRTTEMNFKRIMPVVLGATMSLTPLMGLAQGGEMSGGMGGHGGMYGRKMHGMSRMLNLTDQQQQQLKEARKAESERMKPYHEQIAATHKQIQADIANGSFNEEKTRSLLA